jgi:hypothetical protein
LVGVVKQYLYTNRFSEEETIPVKERCLVNSKLKRLLMAAIPFHERFTGVIFATKN